MMDKVQNPSTSENINTVNYLQDIGLLRTKYVRCLVCYDIKSVVLSDQNDNFYGGVTYIKCNCVVLAGHNKQNLHVANNQLKEYLSRSLPVRSEAPQGSILSPLHFICK
jgi:hypothetical protein